MKKISTIAIAMSALFFVSVSARAQNTSSRNMERRDQPSQNDQYNRDNDNDQYNQRNDQYNRDNRNGQYGQQDQVFNDPRPRPRITVVFGSNGRRDNDRYNDRRRYNDDNRYNRYDRHDRYDRNRSCQSPRRYGY